MTVPYNVAVDCLMGSAPLLLFNQSKPALNGSRRKINQDDVEPYQQVADQ